MIRYVPRRHLQRVSHIGLGLVSVFYRGSNVECPIIGRTYRKFMPYGRLKPRENALCPGSLSLERHRLLWLFLKEKTNLFNEKICLLHIAPEQCFMDHFEEASNIEYITGDIESPLARVRMDIHDIPFPDNSFDAVMCNHVMEHVNDDIRCMSEICRVLKPGGWAIMQVPQDYDREETLEDPAITDPRERERIYWQSDHVRLYGRDYGKRLARAGFNVREDHFLEELGEEKQRYYALPGREIIYYCTK